MQKAQTVRSVSTRGKPLQVLGHQQHQQRGHGAQRCRNGTVHYGTPEAFAEHRPNRVDIAVGSNIPVRVHRPGALGWGRFTDEVIILVVVMVAQNVVQTLAQTKLTAGSLKLSPIVSFGSRIAGGAVLGLLGAALSMPAAAIGSASRHAWTQPPNTKSRRLIATEPTAR